MNRSHQPYLSLVVAARPNFVKAAPLVAALDGHARFELVHSGQHYQTELSAAILEDLGLDEPAVNLGAGSGSHAEQTAAVLVAYERHLLRVQPDAVVVFGDVNSTLAASLAAAKLHIPVAHVEAGLRSHDESMPEEVNRALTDRLSRWLFAPSEEAASHLRDEGFATERIHLVGNVMVDSLLGHRDSARGRASVARRALGIEDGPYVVLTLHRPSNVDDADRLRVLLAAIADNVGGLPVAFPVHPRTERVLRAIPGLPTNLHLGSSLGYLDFLGLIADARAVVTDSGGVQEETSVLGVPCVTVRNSTERAITCELGSNELAGTDPRSVAIAVRRAVGRTAEPARIPLWDGRAGQRVAATLLTDLA